MMFVIIHHCSLPYLTLNGSEWVKYFFCLISFTMPTFTMISGYFFKEKSFLNRVSSYLIPGILFSAINILVAKLSPLESINNRPITQLGYAMWFFFALFIYTVFTQIVIKKVPALILLLGSFVFAIIVCRFSFFNHDVFQLSRIISHYPFFLIGIVLKEKDLLRFREHKKVRILSFLIFAIIYIGNFIISKHIKKLLFVTAFDHPTSPIYESYGILLCSVLSICILLFTPDKKYITTKLGSRTLAPYLLHMCIVFPICWTIGLPYINTWYGIIIYMIATPILCLVLFNSKRMVYWQDWWTYTNRKRTANL